MKIHFKAIFYNTPYFQVQIQKRPLFQLAVAPSKIRILASPFEKTFPKGTFPILYPGT